MALAKYTGQRETDKFEEVGGKTCVNTALRGAVPLPTGAATEAKQDTIISSIDGVETLLGTIDADTSALAGTVNGNEVQVDILSIVPLTGATNLGKADNAAYTSGDTGVAIMAVYNTDTITNGLAAHSTKDYVPLSVDAGANLRTALYSGNAEMPSGSAGNDGVSNSQRAYYSYTRPSLFNGTTWDRQRGDTTYGLDVDVTRQDPVGIKGYRSSDGTYQPLRLDKATDSIQTIDYEHHEIHAGSHFFYYDYDNDVDTAAPKYYRLTTPNTTKWIHIVFTIFSEGAGTWQLFENPTVSGAGTTATTFNSDRNSITSAGLVVAYDATSGGDGTQLKVWRTGSGTTAPSRVGGESRSSNELILKQNEDYFIKFTPDADNCKTKIQVSWYEHTNIV